MTKVKTLTSIPLIFRSKYPPKLKKRYKSPEELLNQEYIIPLTLREVGVILSSINSVGLKKKLLKSLGTDRRSRKCLKFFMQGLNKGGV